MLLESATTQVPKDHQRFFEQVIAAVLFDRDHLSLLLVASLDEDRYILPMIEEVLHHHPQTAHLALLDQPIEMPAPDAQQVVYLRCGVAIVRCPFLGLLQCLYDACTRHRPPPSIATNWANI